MWGSRRCQSIKSWVEEEAGEAKAKEESKKMKLRKKKRLEQKKQSRGRSEKKKKFFFIGSEAKQGGGEVKRNGVRAKQSAGETGGRSQVELR